MSWGDHDEENIKKKVGNNRQKPIEKIIHDVDIEVILKCLWAIRENNQFYFMSYGKEMIEKCVEQKVKKKMNDGS